MVSFKFASLFVLAVSSTQATVSFSRCVGGSHTKPLADLLLDLGAIDSTTIELNMFIHSVTASNLTLDNLEEKIYPIIDAFETAIVHAEESPKLTDEEFSKIPFGGSIELLDVIAENLIRKKSVLTSQPLIARNIGDGLKFVEDKVHEYIEAFCSIVTPKVKKIILTVNLPACDRAFEKLNKAFNYI